MDIGAERYVSFTTYRRNGEPVATPVWIASLPDGRVGFTTGSTSWKVKRLAANPEVSLRPCDMRGRVADGAPELHGTAVAVTDGADHDAVMAAVRRKYGIQYTMLDLGNRLKRLVGRAPAPEASVLVTLR